MPLRLRPLRVQTLHGEAVLSSSGRVLRGKTVGAAAKAGFDTAIDVDMDVGSVRVRALDGEGRVFATSAVVSR